MARPADARSPDPDRDQGVRPPRHQNVPHDGADRTAGGHTLRGRPRPAQGIATTRTPGGVGLRWVEKAGGAAAAPGAEEDPGKGREAKDPVAAAGPGQDGQEAGAHSG
jgi:hypothetical protein